MTWLSRLLPQSPSLRLADRNNRTRQSHRRRRMATLESLEERTLLSNLLLTFSHTANGQSNGSTSLIITGSTANAKFTVTENLSGTVTVTGTTASGLPAPQTAPHTPITGIQGNGPQFTTSQTITYIDIVLPGDSRTTDTVTITGHGAVKDVVIVVPGASATVPGANLILNVNNLHNSGALDLYDAPTYRAATVNPLPDLEPGFAPPSGVYTPPTSSDGNPINLEGGKLAASVTSSSFATMTLEQDGCCQSAIVTLDHDIVPGQVIVLEGTYGGFTPAPGSTLAPTLGNVIVATNDNFGPTVMAQYYGPTTFPSVTPGQACDGENDLILVQDTTGNGIFDLIALQLGYGTGQQILIGTDVASVPSDVEVSLFGFGIIAAQPFAGGSDTIHIESITQTPVTTNSRLWGPPSIITFQGDGNGERAIVDSSVVFGNIIVIQGNGGPVPTLPGVPVTGPVIGDSVHIANDQIGYTIPSGPYLTIDKYGLLAVIQGNGYEDSIVVDSNGSEPTPVGNIFNNALLVQGNGLNGSPFPCCNEVTGDTVDFEQAAVTSDLVIVQGFPFRMEDAGVTGLSAAGLNADATALNGMATSTSGLAASLAASPSLTPAVDTSELLAENGYATVTIGATEKVTVGEETFIFQFGANNTVLLGGAGDASGVDFETNFLDIWTGIGGGGTVVAQNTDVQYGSLFFANVINGGDGNNTYDNTLDGNDDNGLPFLSFSANYVCFGC